MSSNTTTVGALTDYSAMSDDTKQKRKFGAARLNKKSAESTSSFGIPSKEGPNNILRNAGSKLSPEFYQREIEELQRQIRNYKLYYCFVAAYCSVGRMFTLPLQLVAIYDARMNGEKSEGLGPLVVVIIMTGIPWMLKPFFAWYCDRFFPFRYRIKGYALVISILNIFIMSVVHFSSEVYVFEIAVEIYFFTIVILDTIAQGMMTATISLERRLLEKIHPFSPIRRRRYSQEIIKLMDIRIRDKPEEIEAANSSNKAVRQQSIFVTERPTDEEWQLESENGTREEIPPTPQEQSNQSQRKKGAGIKKEDFIWEPSYTSNYALYLAAYYFFGYFFTFVSYNVFIRMLQDKQEKVTNRDLEQFSPPIYISIGCSLVLLVYSYFFKELRKESWINQHPTQIRFREVMSMLFQGRPSLLVGFIVIIGTNPLNYLFEKMMLACRVQQQHHDMIDLKTALITNSPIALTGLIMLVVMVVLRNRIRWAGLRKLGGTLILAQIVAGVMITVYSYRDSHQFLSTDGMQYAYALACCLIWEGVGALCRLCLVERFLPSTPDGHEVFVVNVISALVSSSRWLGKFMYILQAFFIIEHGKDEGLRWALLIDSGFVVAAFVMLWIYKNTKSETYKIRYSEKTADLLRWKLLEPSTNTQEFTIDIEGNGETKEYATTTGSTVDKEPDIQRAGR